MDVEGEIRARADPQYVAAYDLIAAGELPDLGPAVKQIAVSYAGSAAAGACTAIGAAPAAPLCQYIGGEIAAWVFDEVWPSVEEFFSDAADSIAEFFGYGSEATEREAKRRAVQAAAFNLAAIGDTINGVQNMAWRAWTSAVGGLELLAARLGLTALAPYGYAEVAARLSSLHGVRLVRYAPAWPLVRSDGSEEQIAAGSLAVPEWFLKSSWTIDYQIPRDSGVPRNCTRAAWSTAAWVAALAANPRAGTPEDREERTLWIACAGGPTNAVGTAAKLAAAALLTNQIIGWIGNMQRAAAAEAALLVQLAAGLEAARVAAVQAEVDVASASQYEQELARYNATTPLAERIAGARALDIDATAYARTALSVPKTSQTGLVVALVGGAVAAGGAAWWISRRARRRRRS
jgi:hypothetical protein